MGVVLGEGEFVYEVVVVGGYYDYFGYGGYGL